MGTIPDPFGTSTDARICSSGFGVKLRADKRDSKRGRGGLV